MAFVQSQCYQVLCTNISLENYLQNNRDDNTNPRALSLGQATATNTYNGYYLFAALASAPIGVLSNTKLGRFKTLILSLMLVQLLQELLRGHFAYFNLAVVSIHLGV